MFAFLSVTSFCYILYLYNYDYHKFNMFIKKIGYFSNSYKYTEKCEKKSFEKKPNEKKYHERDIENCIVEEYDMTDRPLSEDYYDDSGSTDFVETMPMLRNFYCFENFESN